MRMWMLPPELLCDQHLLGEHVELHMLAGALRRGKSIQGHIDRGQLEPQNARKRHFDLSFEMSRRGMKHQSPLTMPQNVPHGTVNLRESVTELRRRCPQCRERLTPRG